MKLQSALIMQEEVNTDPAQDANNPTSRLQYLAASEMRALPEDSLEARLAALSSAMEGTDVSVQALAAAEEAAKLEARAARMREREAKRAAKRAAGQAAAAAGEPPLSSVRILSLAMSTAACPPATHGRIRPVCQHWPTLWRFEAAGRAERRRSGRARNWGRNRELTLSLHCLTILADEGRRCPDGQCVRHGGADDTGSCHKEERGGGEEKGRGKREGAAAKGASNASSKPFRALCSPSPPESLDGALGFARTSCFTRSRARRTHDLSRQEWEEREEARKQLEEKMNEERNEAERKRAEQEARGGYLHDNLSIVAVFRSRIAPTPCP